MAYGYKGFALVAAAATMATPAQGACWSGAAYEAAQVRELDTMLMVEALRCRATPANFVSDYNAFVSGSRAVLVRANDALRAHFAAAGGRARALDAYDGYVTAVANRYGAGSAGLACADMASIARAAAAANGSGQALAELARLADMRPTLPGGRCEVEPSTLSVAQR